MDRKHDLVFGIGDFGICGQTIKKGMQHCVARAVVGKPSPLGCVLQMFSILCIFSVFLTFFLCVPQPPLVQAIFNRNADEVQLYLHKKDEVNALVCICFSLTECWRCC